MTQIGLVGLGKMGGNMAHRIRRDSDHEVIGFARSERSVQQAVKHGAIGANSLRDLVKRLEPPRMVWLMLPAGGPTEETVGKLAKLLERGDLIIDGGNSQPYVGAEREAAQHHRQSRVAVAQKIQCIAHIIHLAAPLVIGPGAMSYSPEVETQRRHTQRLQRLRHLEDHLVMHRPTPEGMRVADQRGITGRYPHLFGLQNSLQVPLRSRYIDMQYLADNYPFLSRIHG